jgi:hypothetical protein
MTRGCRASPEPAHASFEYRALVIELLPMLLCRFSGEQSSHFRQRVHDPKKDRQLLPVHQ